MKNNQSDKFKILKWNETKQDGIPRTQIDMPWKMWLLNQAKNSIIVNKNRINEMSLWGCQTKHINYELWAYKKMRITPFILINSPNNLNQSLVWTKEKHKNTYKRQPLSLAICDLSEFWLLEKFSCCEEKMKTNSQTIGSCACRSNGVNWWVLFVRTSMIVRWHIFYV